MAFTYNPLQHSPRRPVAVSKTYEEQIWPYLVIEVAPEIPHRYGQREGFDSERAAVENCQARRVPAFVERTLSGERIYDNF